MEHVTATGKLEAITDAVMNDCEEVGTRPWDSGGQLGADGPVQTEPTVVARSEAKPASTVTPVEPHHERQPYHRHQQKVECNFCRRLGEKRSFFRSHNLRDPVTNAVTCPILRKHQCEICGATGDNSHTRSYCPQKPEGTFNMGLLKDTPRNSTQWRRGT